MTDYLKVTWKDQEIRNLLNGEGGLSAMGVRKAAGVLRDKAKGEITAAGRINTGALRNSIMARRVAGKGGADSVWYEVGSLLPYARYQHDGVKGPIYPRRAKFLRFKPKGSQTYVFARQVAGFRGIHFLTKPLQEMKASDFTA